MIPMIKRGLLLIILTISCSSNNNDTIPENDSETEITDPNTPVVPSKNTVSGFEFIDEFIIPNQEIGSEQVGGLSGIDYQNGKWYIICDTSTPPIRFYEANISYNNEFTTVDIHTMIEMKDVAGSSLPQGVVDPEAIRFDPVTKNIVYTSEGSINNSVDPAVVEINGNGNEIKKFSLPDNFKANTIDDTSGPRHNGVLEGLSLAVDNSGYWVSLELPLIEDGPEPIITDTQSPVRVTFINKTTNTAERQFAYELDPVAREPALGTTFMVNGLVEILEYDTNKFLALERSFSSGYIDGGNTVKIYNVDASEATNTISKESLNGNDYTAATKTLLFNFETIRGKLTANTVDNIEGITFGPNLDDGSRTVVVISDNNFNSFFPQYNQLIALKVVP
ncbi:esterase-like activity of phytase family protein [Aquimarina sp. 2201CG1-2-11]|uniref:esterase-like activity of phytase family protein n=1 Tax=Aquimarina discodermiae TaxID=3231043 RepID=UPI003462BFAC